MFGTAACRWSVPGACSQVYRGDVADDAFHTLKALVVRIMFTPRSVRATIITLSIVLIIMEP